MCSTRPEFIKYNHDSRSPRAKLQLFYHPKNARRSQGISHSRNSRKTISISHRYIIQTSCITSNGMDGMVSAWSIDAIFDAIARMKWNATLAAGSTKPKTVDADDNVTHNILYAARGPNCDLKKKSHAIRRQNKQRNQDACRWENTRRFAKYIKINC